MRYRIPGRQTTLLFLAIGSLIVLFFFIIFGDDGLRDLRVLKREKAEIEEKIEKLKMENVEKYREIDRLENDPGYIEEIARKELGMVKNEEIVIKPNPVTPESD